MRRVALVVVDMQKAFWKRKGSWRKRHPHKSLINKKRTLTAIEQLIDHAIERGWKIVFTRVVFKTYGEKSPLLMKYPTIKNLKAYKEGSYDVEWVDELENSPKDLIIDKRSYSAFTNPEFLLFLNQNKIKEIVVCGILTNVCVESTVRHGFELGFHMWVVKEATTTYSNKLWKASLETMKHFANVLSLQEILDTL